MLASVVSSSVLVGAGQESSIGFKAKKGIVRRSVDEAGKEAVRSLLSIR